MKLLIAISAALVIHIAVSAPRIPSVAEICVFAPFRENIDTCAEENRAFAEAFIHELRQKHSNAAGREGAEKAVYEIFYKLFDATLLNRYGIPARSHQGAYYWPQTNIRYTILPAGCTLKPVQKLMSKINKSRVCKPEKQSRSSSPAKDKLVSKLPDYSKLPTKKIDPFFAETKFAPDSVLYISEAETNRLAKFVEEHSGSGVIEKFSLVYDVGGYIPDQPLQITHIILESDLRRALVKMDVDMGHNNGNWDVMIERTKEGEWKVFTVLVRSIYYVIW